MKNLFLLLFGVLFLVAGCKKDKDDPAPKTASQTVVGLYTINKFKQGTDELTLPITLNGVTISGTVNIAAIAGQNDKVDVTLTIKQTGSPDDAQTISGVDLQAASPGYKLVYQGQQLGTADGTTVVLSDDDLTITAKK